MITIAYSILLSPAPEMLFIKCLLTIPYAPSVLSNRVMPGNWDSAKVKIGGTPLSSKKVWSFACQTSGIRESHEYLARLASFPTRIPHHSCNDFYRHVPRFSQPAISTGTRTSRKVFSV